LKFKNHQFDFFGGKIKIREPLIMGISRNIKELGVFMKELVKDWQLQRQVCNFFSKQLGTLVLKKIKFFGYRTLVCILKIFIPIG
jgi:hypothetical protein